MKGAEKAVRKWVRMRMAGQRAGCAHKAGNIHEGDDDGHDGYIRVAVQVEDALIPMAAAPISNMPHDTRSRSRGSLPRLPRPSVPTPATHPMNEEAE